MQDTLAVHRCHNQERQRSVVQSLKGFLVRCSRNVDHFEGTGHSFAMFIALNINTIYRKQSIATRLRIPLCT